MAPSWVELQLEALKDLKDKKAQKVALAQVVLQNRMTMVLIAIAKRTYFIGMHLGDCDVHHREIPMTRFEQDNDAPIQFTEPKRCSCGWQEEANELNELLRIMETAR